MTSYNILRLTVTHDGPLHYVKVKVRIESPAQTVIRSFNKTVEAANAFKAVEAAMTVLVPQIEAKTGQYARWFDGEGDA